MPRAGLSAEAVVDAGLAVVDEYGLDGLTLTRVASHTGVATPSLYKHIDGLPALRRALRLRVLRDLTEQLRTAVLGLYRDAAVRALASAYREYLRRYPLRHRLVEDAPATGDEALGTAADDAVAVTFAILRGYGLDDDQLVHATRSLRAAVGGFVRLEATGGFGRPLDVDASFAYLVNLYLAGLASTVPRST